MTRYAIYEKHSDAIDPSDESGLATILRTFQNVFFTLWFLAIVSGKDNDDTGNGDNTNDCDGIKNDDNATKNTENDTYGNTTTNNDNSHDTATIFAKNNTYDNNDNDDDLSQTPCQIAFDDVSTWYVWWYNDICIVTSINDLTKMPWK